MESNNKNYRISRRSEIDSDKIYITVLEGEIVLLAGVSYCPIDKVFNFPDSMPPLPMQVFEEILRVAEPIKS